LERVITAETSIVNLSTLAGSTRIDAEFYQPHYLSVYDAVNKIECTTIGRIAQKCKKGIFDIKAQEYTPAGIPFIRITNLKEGLIDDTDLAFIPPRIHRSEIGTEFQEDDIALSKTAYPAASLITFDKCNISQDIIGLSLSSHWKRKLNSAYVVAFLNSKYGLSEMKQWFQGNVQMHLALPDVKRILIPVISRNEQKKIKTLYDLARSQQQESASLQAKANDLFSAQLGLLRVDSKYSHSYTASLSDAIIAQRADAEYFQPCYQELITKVAERAELRELRSFFQNDMQKGVEVGSENYEDAGNRFIRVSNVSTKGLIDRDQKNISGELFEGLKDLYQPLLGDILLTKDATPGIAYVLKEEIDGIISSGILRLQIDETEINKEYLAFCINSLFGKLQVERDCGGSVITHWRPKQIKKLLIPVLPDIVQRDIGLSVTKSYMARTAAKRSLAEAHIEVEASIRMASEAPCLHASR
jgi:type I restriction enzyme S subunit